MIGQADRHGALGEGAIHRVLGGGAEPDPFVAEAGFDAVVDHRLQQVAVRLVADPVQQIALGAQLLQAPRCRLVMVDAGQAILHEFLGDEGHAVAAALLLLGGGVGDVLADLVEWSAWRGR